MPTIFHKKYICAFAKIGSNIFVEKPGALNKKEAKEIKKIIKKNKVNLFVSFQKRFHPITQKLKKMISSNSIKKIFSVRVLVNSYVPNWHKYENFLELYACKKELGGGVIRTECHEIDLICSLFGLPKKIKYNYNTRSSYKINVEDSAELIFIYKKFAVQFSLSFMQKKQMRIIEIFSENKYIYCDYLKQEMITEDLNIKTKVKER